MASKLEEETLKLIGYKHLTSTTGRVSDRAKRKMDKIGNNIYDILKKRKEKRFEREGIVVGLRWSDEAPAWARNISLALEELKQDDPEAYKRVEAKIQKHRTSRRAYIEFSGDISEQLYTEIIQEVMGGISYEEANEIYRAMIKMEEFLGKSNGLQKLLLPE